MVLMASLRSSICYLEWLEKGRGWGWGRGTGTHREETGQGMPGPHKQQEASILGRRVVEVTERADSCRAPSHAQF